MLPCVGIIQARMGSRRFPKKMVKKLNGTQILEWVVTRCRKSKNVDQWILATTTLKEDDMLEIIANRLGIKVFRGDEKNVLNRYFSAALDNSANIIVRVCADNPFISAEAIDELYNFFLNNEYEIAQNSHISSGYPDGVGAEIFSIEFLRKLVSLTKNRKYLEHVTLYAYEHPEKFKIGNAISPFNWEALPFSWDIDTPEDLKVLSEFINDQKVEINSTLNQIVNSMIKYSHKKYKSNIN
tara:strand:+ start:1844 stop:2563 length:720 start_codon:yes stop_codon:yes gene_type:complete